VTHRSSCPRSERRSSCHATTPPCTLETRTVSDDARAHLPGPSPRSCPRRTGRRVRAPSPRQLHRLETL
jgi:hypothetical protein